MKKLSLAKRNFIITIIGIALFCTYVGVMWYGGNLRLRNRVLDCVRLFPEYSREQCEWWVYQE